MYKNQNHRNRTAIWIVSTILAPAIIALMALAGAIFTMLPARADTNPAHTADTITSINFASGELYEGADVDTSDVTITVTFEDGYTRTLDDSEVSMPTGFVGHYEMTIPVGTEYGTFNWNVPINPVGRIYIDDTTLAVGDEVSADSLIFMTEFANGRHFIARPSLLQVPDVTVKIGNHDTITVRYDGIEYDVVVP